MATKKFVCKVCGYVHEGATAPETCPLCKAPASAFEEMPSESSEGSGVVEEPKKKAFDTNSNLYIIIYSVVMVVIVATLLAVASLSLKPFQEENALNEKKTQIVKALTGKDDAKYADNIDKAYILKVSKDADGNKSITLTEDESAAFAALKDVKATFDSGNNLPLFKAKDGSVVVPLYGAGLWGPIWGYLALEKDLNTVKGVVFAHKGETPGLGAEIATDKHQALYPGKKIFEGEKLVGIALVKGGADKSSLHEVDAISGGTKTSDGVSKMIVNSLSLYLPYLQQYKSDAAVETPTEPLTEAENVAEEASAPAAAKVQPAKENTATAVHPAETATEEQKETCLIK